MVPLTRLAGMLVLSSILAAATQDARAAGMYNVTNLTTLSGHQLNDQGQVVGTGYLQGDSPTAPTYALRYNSYGPNAGQTDVVGGANSQGIGINDAGQVVGNDFSQGMHAFLNSGGQVTQVGGSTSTADGINNAGQILGANLGAAGNTMAGEGIYDPQTGQQTPLARPANYVDQGGSTALNSAGQAAGALTYVDPTPPSPTHVPVTWEHAMLWSQGQPQDLGTLGGKNSYATGLNGSGIVVGNSNVDPSSGDFHAFVYKDGTMHDLGTFGGRNSYANAINGTGDVVGSSWLTGDSASHAFLYKNGQMLDLNTLVNMPSGLTLSSAIDINARGQILALGDMVGPNNTLVSTTYLLTPDDQPVPADALPPTPVPEPTVLTMMGLVAVACVVRRAGWTRGA